MIFDHARALTQIADELCELRGQRLIDGNIHYRHGYQEACLRFERRTLTIRCFETHSMELIWGVPEGASGKPFDYTETDEVDEYTYTLKQFRGQPVARVKVLDSNIGLSGLVFDFGNNCLHILNAGDDTAVESRSRHERDEWIFPLCG